MCADGSVHFVGVSYRTVLDIPRGRDRVDLDRRSSTATAWLNSDLASPSVAAEGGHARPAPALLHTKADVNARTVAGVGVVRRRSWHGSGSDLSAAGVAIDPTQST